MSSAIAYAVDLHEVRGLLSGDGSDAHARALIEHGVEVDYLQQFLRPGYAAQEVPTALAMFARMCAVLGRKLSSEGLEHFRAGFELDVHDALPAPLRERCPLSQCLDRTQAFGFPNADDFPAVGYLEAEDVAFGAEWAKQYPLGYEEDDDIDVALVTYEGWLEQAAEMKRGLVGFIVG